MTKYYSLACFAAFVLSIIAFVVAEAVEIAALTWVGLGLLAAAVIGIVIIYWVVVRKSNQQNEKGTK